MASQLRGVRRVSFLEHRVDGTTQQDIAWINALPQEERGAAALLQSLKERTASNHGPKRLPNSWRAIIWEHCVRNVTVSRNALAKALNLSRPTLFKRLKDPDDPIAQAFDIARNWLHGVIANPMLRRVRNADQDDASVDDLRLRLLRTMHPETWH